MSDQDSFWDASDDAGSDIVQNGRYRITAPDTGKSTLVSRASNTCKSLDNTFALGRSRQRKLLKGLTKRPDILRRLLTTTDPDSIPVKDLDDMIASGLANAGDSLDGSNEGANEGTAAHNVLQEVDRGVTNDDIPDEYHALADAYRFELQRAGLTPVATELTVYNSRFKRVGRLDNIYQDRSGKLVVGDKKTTRWIEYSKNAIAGQVGIYNSADWICLEQNPQADAQFQQITEQMRVIDDYAILVLIDLDNNTVSLYRVDTEHGRRGAVLEQQVKAWSNAEGVILPYVAPGDSAMFGAEAITAQPLQAQVTFPTAQVDAGHGTGDVIDNPLPDEQLFAGRNAGAVAPSTGAAVGPRGVETNLYDLKSTPQVEPRPATAGPPFTTAFAASSPEPTLAPSQSVINNHPQASAPAPQAGQLSAEQLAQLDKSELVAMLTALGWADVKHHRKWLAEKIVELRAGGGAVAAAPAPIPAKPAPVPQNNPIQPTAEIAAQVRQALEQCVSVTDIRGVHENVQKANIVWTEEFTGIARSVAARIDQQAQAATVGAGAPPATVSDDPDVPQVQDFSEPNQELDIMARINDISGQGDLAEIWNDVTEQGTNLSVWTAEVQQFAEKKLAEVSKPATVVNPFGN